MQGQFGLLVQQQPQSVKYVLQAAESCGFRVHAQAAENRHPRFSLPSESWARSVSVSIIIMQSTNQ